MTTRREFLKAFGLAATATALPSIPVLGDGWKKKPASQCERVLHVRGMPPGSEVLVWHGQQGGRKMLFWWQAAGDQVWMAIPEELRGAGVEKIYVRINHPDHAPFTAVINIQEDPQAVFPDGTPVAPDLIDWIEHEVVVKYSDSTIEIPGHGAVGVHVGMATQHVKPVVKS